MNWLPLSRSDLRPLMWILALPTALMLPFLGQPIHMDDSIYLDIARNILKNPSHPHDFPYCFEGYCAPDMASHSHPPFVGYWLAFWLKLFGDSMPAWGLHAAYLPFVWLLVASSFALARRFSDRPLMVSLIATSIPVVVVMSHNLMSDYPNLALWTASLALYISGIDRDRPGWIWLAAGFMTLSAFTSYPSLLIPLLCWAYAAQRKSRMRAARWAPALPFLWMGIWLSYSSAYFGRFVLGGTGRYFIENRGVWTPAVLADKLLAFPVFLAGVVFVPWGLIGQVCRWMWGRLALLMLLVVAAIVQISIPNYEPSQKLLFGLLLEIGILAIIALLAGLFAPQTRSRLNDVERKDRRFLMLWMGLVTLMVLFLYPAASARYMMPLTLPFLLLAVKVSPATRSESRLPHLALSLVFGVLLALGLSVADYQAATARRDIGRELGSEFRGWENRVRFGAEWGLRYYLQEQGFRQFLSTSADFSGADFIVLPDVAIPYDLPQDVDSMSFVVDERMRLSNFSLRLMSRKAHAGFYSSGWGLLPFSFSSAPLETVKILQVSCLVEKLPEIHIEPRSGAGAAIPLRGAEGQLDLQLPLPFDMVLPYSAPPAAILFEWCQVQSPMMPGSENNLSPPPDPELQAAIDTGAAVQPLRVRVSGDWRRAKDLWSREFQIAVPAVAEGYIRLRARSAAASQPDKGLLRNWRILPRTLTEVAR